VILQKTTSIWILLTVLPAAARAQSSDVRPVPAVEFTAGYAGFVDDQTIDHALFGAAARFHLLPRVSIGPELQYMIGPADDRDLVVTGNITLDVLSPAHRVTPFFVMGGGLFHHSDSFGSSTEGAFTAGGGVRAWLSDRLYVASEFRLGWELHYRITGTIGVATRNPR
jgi:hypothetical protein